MRCFKFRILLKIIWWMQLSEGKGSCIGGGILERQFWNSHNVGGRKEFEKVGYVACNIR